MVRILDGKVVADSILNNIEKDIKELDYIPRLDIISVGDNDANNTYIKNKIKACDRVGMKAVHHHLDNANIASIVGLINDLNNDNEVDGIIVQSPVAGLDKNAENELFDFIDTIKDVDCFNKLNVSNLYHGTAKFHSCTPEAILQILDFYNIPVEGKHVVIVGRSEIVGKPLALALLNRNATVTICHSKTEDLSKITEQADILVSAVGKANLIHPYHINSSEIDAIIDVGINRDSNGKLCGDVSNDVLDMLYFIEDELDNHKIQSITPVPGGVGPVTVACLLKNTLLLSKIRRNCSQ